MPTPQQENFGEMINSIFLKYPEYPSPIIKRDINNILRSILSRRPWSGIVTYAILPIPDATDDGTVTVTVSSNVVTGSATGWPFIDVVNTTLSEATIETGMIDLTPVSMTGIKAGQWILLDRGNAGEEAVFAISITSTTFRARCASTHAAAINVSVSSLAGQQIRLQAGYPFFTVTGVSSATRLLTQETWGNDTMTAQDYAISLVYMSLGRNIKQLLTLVNLTQAYRFTVDVPQGLLDARDVMRSASGFPYALSFKTVDPGGVPLYEMYPRQTVRAQFPYIYVQQWTPLEDPNDILPNGIRSDIIVKMAEAEAARWPGHKKVAGGVYYDPNLSRSLILEAQRDIEYMTREDDSTAIMTLYYQYSAYGPGGGGPKWEQQHDSYAYDV